MQRLAPTCANLCQLVMGCGYLQVATIILTSLKAASLMCVEPCCFYCLHGSTKNLPAENFNQRDLSRRPSILNQTGLPLSATQCAIVASPGQTLYVVVHIPMRESLLTPCTELILPKGCKPRIFVKISLRLHENSLRLLGDFPFLLGIPKSTVSFYTRVAFLGPAASQSAPAPPS